MQFDTASAPGSGAPSTLTTDDRCRPHVGDFIGYTNPLNGQHFLYRVIWVKLYAAAAGNGSLGQVGVEAESTLPPPPPPPAA